MDNEDGTVEIFDQWNLTPEQAIAATLGVREQPPYDELIEVLWRDWDIEASWDGLRRFWYIGLTDDGVRKRDEREATLVRGMLTADDVRDLIERHSDASGGNGRDFHNGAYVAIADELNATLGQGTCHDLGGTDENDEQVFNCSECGCVLSLYDRDGINNLCTSFIIDYPRYCPECGRKVVTDG